MEYSLFPVDCKPYRVLDVIQPMAGRAVDNYINIAERAYGEWRTAREKASQPILNGRFGIGRCRSGSGGSPMEVLTFTEHVTSEHPFYDKPDLIADAVNDLLETIMSKFVIRSFDPAIIYYGDKAWMRRRFPPLTQQSA